MQANTNQYDPQYFGDASFDAYAQQQPQAPQPYPSMPPPGLPERKSVVIDVGEFVRTRDAVSRNARG
jgi:hypothetical protein